MNTRTLKLLAYIPPDPLAREFITESLLIARQFRAPISWIANRDESAEARDFVTSLFPKWHPAHDEEILLSKEPPEESLPAAIKSTGSDILLIGPVSGEENEIAMNSDRIVELTRELSCSVLLFPRCHKGTRLRQIVCNIEYNNRALAAYEFARHLSTLCHASLLHAVREEDPRDFAGPPRSFGKLAAARWRASEDYLLQEFVGDDAHTDPPVVTAIVLGKRGSAITHYIDKVHADLLVQSASSELALLNASSQLHQPTGTTSHRDCCLLLHREKGDDITSRS